MEILSFGAGMQSTALALMSCENAMAGGRDYYPHPLIPVYDAVIFCDLGLEASWVYEQLLFVQHACEKAGIPFYVLESNLYEDYTRNYGERRVVSIPWWTVKENGQRGKVSRRFCTLDYKTTRIANFVRWELLGYKKGSRNRPEDLKAHTMHIGFSIEEQHRCKDNPHPFFVNRFPLVELGLDRAANFAYIYDQWGLATKSSACSFCPFHRNFFFKKIKETDPAHYAKILDFDRLLASKKPHPAMDAQFFISRSWKRLEDLTEEDCNDAECFEYCGKHTDKPIMVWNGF